MASEPGASSLSPGARPVLFTGGRVWEQPPAVLPPYTQLTIRSAMFLPVLVRASTNWLLPPSNTSTTRNR